MKHIRTGHMEGSIMVGARLLREVAFRHDSKRHGYDISPLCNPTLV